MRSAVSSIPPSGAGTAAARPIREGSCFFSSSSVGISNANGGISDGLAMVAAVDSAHHRQQPACLSPRPASSFPATPALSVNMEAQARNDALGSEPQVEEQTLSSERGVPRGEGVFSAGEKEGEIDRLAPPSENMQLSGRKKVEVDSPAAAGREDGVELGQRRVEAAVRGASFSAGEESGDEDWCPLAARARACEAVPQLAEAFRSFDEKHPGATIM